MTSPQPPLIAPTPQPGTLTAAGQLVAPPPVRKPPLKIGDIVFCCRWCTGVFPEDPEKPSLYSLLAEGIVDDKVEGINSDDWLPQPNLCLFKIEAPSGLQSRHMTSSEAKLEAKASRESYRLSLGTILKYGMEVQLRHVHSGGLLSLDLTNASETPGAWSVVVRKKTDEDVSTLITLVPFKKLQGQGDVINYNEPVSVVFQNVKLKYFLQSDRPIANNKIDINCSHKATAWHFRLFEGYDAPLDCIRCGTPLHLKYKKLGLFMQVGEPEKLFFDKKTTGSAHAEHTIGQRRPVSKKSKDDYSSFWLLQDQDFMAGGSLAWESRFYIRNAKTGEFLVSELQLAEKPDPNFYFTLPRPGNFKPSSFVPYQYPLLIKCSDGRILSLDQKKCNEEIFFHLIPPQSTSTQDDVSPQIDVVLETVSYDKRESLFEFQPIEDVYTSFFMQINSLNPRFQEMKLFFEHFRTKQEDLLRGPTWDDIEQAEKRLLSLKVAIDSVLDTVKHSITTEIYKERQSIMTGLWLHKVLIEIAAILASTFQRKREGGQPVAESLKELSSKSLSCIWSILNQMASENSVACKRMSEQQIILCDLLPYDNRNVGALLTEIYRLVEPDIKDPRSFFYEWCARLDTVRDSNLQEQVIYLRILKNLCEADKISTEEYQKEIFRHLFNSNISFTLVKLERADSQDRVYFAVKKKALEKPIVFTEVNPRLTPMLQTNEAGEQFVLLSDMSSLPDYIEYMHAALMMLSCMCKGKVKEIRDAFEARLGVTVPVIMSISENPLTHIRIREGCLYLVESLCVSCSPYQPLSIQDNIYSFSEIRHLSERLLASENVLIDEGKNNAEVRRCLQGMLMLWLRVELPEDITKWSADEQMNYVKAALNLTCSLIQFNHCNDLYTKCISRALSFLLAGLCNAQDQLEAPYWGATLMATVLEQASSGDIMLRIYLNDMLTKILNTYLMICRRTRRDRLQRLLVIAVRNREFLRAYKTPLFATKDDDPPEIKAVLEAVANVLDEEADQRDINELIRSQDFNRKRTRLEASLTDSLLSSPMPTVVSAPDFDLREVLTRGPKMKDVFVKVTLEWADFSKEMKNVIIQLMKEVFKDKRMVNRTLQLVDIFSLGPLTQIYDRVNWLKQYSELSALIVRSKYESLMLGKSRSLARIIHLLEYATNFIHPYLITNQLVLKKTQNIFRHIGLHRYFIHAWTLCSYLEKVGKGADSPTLTLQAAISTFLLYFIKDNALNKKEITKLLHPRHFFLNVIQYSEFVQDFTGYTNLALNEVTRIFQYILLERKSLGLNALHFFKVIMSDQDGVPKKDRQNVASTLLAETISESLSSAADNPAMFGKLLILLSFAAQDNSPVLIQCRYLFSFPHLKDLLLKERHPEIFTGLLTFLCVIYLTKVDKLDTITDPNEVLDVLQPAIDLIIQIMAHPRELVALGAEGTYPCVYCKANPSFADIMVNFPSADPAARSRWNSLYYKYQENEDGLLILLPRIFDNLGPQPQVAELLLPLLPALQQLASDVQQLSDTLTEFLSFIPLQKALAQAQETLQKYLESSEVPPPEAAVVQQTFEFDEEEMQKVRFPYENSIRFLHRDIEDSELEVDTLMDLTLGVFFSVFDKSQSLEDENAYITAIVSRIDEKLGSGQHMSKKEVKETIPVLAKKIRGVQRLFTTSKQRILFYKILEGIVPDEDRIPLKVQLSTVFEMTMTVESAIESIIRHDTVEEMNAALEFLCKLLLGQSREFMDRFKSLLTSTRTFNLFMLIQSELNTAKASIIEKAREQKEKESSGALMMLSHLMVRRQTGGSPQAASKRELLLQNFMHLVQLSCDNCNVVFQEYYFVQNSVEGKADVDLLNGVAGFLVELRFVSRFIKFNKGVNDIVVSVLSVLVDFVTGPCQNNQKILGNNVMLYLAMNNLVAATQEDTDEEATSIQNMCIQFLLTLLEGRPDPTIWETMSKFLDLGMLRRGCEFVFDRYIKGNEEDVMLELETINAKYQEKVQSAILQAILLTKLRRYGIVSEELNLFASPNLDPLHCYSFYMRFIGYVELSRNDVLEAHHFPIPFKCKFLTPASKLAMIMEVNRNTHQEKIENFLELIPRYMAEMIHQQELSRNKPLKKISGLWRFYGKTSFLLIMIINITLLATVHDNEMKEFRENPWLFFGVIVLGIITFIFNFAKFTFYLIEYLPNTKVKPPKESLDALEIDDFYRMEHGESQLMLEKYEKSKQASKATYASELQLRTEEALGNKELYYSFMYFLLSVYALYEPAFFPFLLLDVIKQTPELVNILKSITLNFRQLILTLVLGVIIIYLFAVVSFVTFQDYYLENDLPCEDLWNCFFSTLNVGIRSGGGIADGIGAPKVEEGDYYPRMVFDLLFYIIIIIILLNIIFGIIIDTFAELRDQRSCLLEDISNCCFICGQERSDIELHGSKWSYHFMVEHSPYAYVSFLVYLHEKKIYDCTGLEKHVKECLAQSNYAFMPQSSIRIQGTGDDDEGS